MTGKKLLIVDDDTDIVRAMGTRLRAHGYQVVLAPDAVAAISTARAEKPDLIILDIGLPGGDGFVVLERLKAVSELTLIPVIVLSARHPTPNRDRALQAGAQAFFQKPVDNDEFLAAIRKALGEPRQMEWTRAF
jgi:two-component system KDP operon response regulator KdpE